MEKKQCRLCHQELDICNFSRTTYKNGNERIRNDCKVCRCKVESEKRKANPVKYKEKDSCYYASHKDEIKDKNAQYRSSNSQALSEQKKKYYNANKQQILQYHQSKRDDRNQYLRTRRHEDAMFRIACSLRSRIHSVLKNIERSKTNHLLGCSRDQLDTWLSSQFSDTMNLQNYGKIWHIDHVIPLSFFNLVNKHQQQLCFHWTNLRPLPVCENLSKSAKILPNDIVRHSFHVIEFCKGHYEYQASLETDWWRRLQLRYGNNLKDEDDFENHLRWAIRSQAPNSDIDKDMEKVQRLNVSGSEGSSQS